MIVRVAAAEALAVVAPRVLPLRVRAVEYDDPGLTVIGDRWALAHRADESASLAGEQGTDDSAWDLIGLDIVGVRAGRRHNQCTFDLSDRSALDVTPDGSGYEAWVFRHDSLDVVYVGV
jgi:hypothetical protein